MNSSGVFGDHHLISYLFLGSALSALVGILMFTYRVFLHGRIFIGFVRWERGLGALAALICALGFIALAAALRVSGERTVSSAALGVLALGTALIVVAELRVVVGPAITLGLTAPLPGLGGANLLITLGVALTFIGQAAYGGSLLQTALTPAWASWLLIIWNLGFLAVVFVFSARDPYYPVLFYTGPVVLGMLFWR